MLYYEIKKESKEIIKSGWATFEYGGILSDFISNDSEYEITFYKVRKVDKNIIPEGAQYIKQNRPIALIKWLRERYGLNLRSAVSIARSYIPERVGEVVQVSVSALLDTIAKEFIEDYNGTTLDIIIKKVNDMMTVGDVNTIRMELKETKKIKEEHFFKEDEFNINK